MHPLTSKVVKVITSCRTQEQLEVATRYYNLAFKKLSKQLGAVNDSEIYSLSLEAMGYAICNIRYLEGRNHV